MRIGIDGAKAVAGEREFYTREVIGLLATDFPQYSLSVYTPKVNRKTRLDLIDELHNVEYRLPAPSGFSGRMWQLFGITNCLLPDKIDVYHGLNGELPLNIAAAHVPAVLTVSDTSWIDSHEGMLDVSRKFRRYVMTASCRNATLILAGSDDIKKELSERLGIEELKVEVCPSESLTAGALLSAYKKAIERFHEINRSR